MRKLTIVTVVGARPQFIKAAAVSRAIAAALRRLCRLGRLASLAILIACGNEVAP